MSHKDGEGNLEKDAGEYGYIQGQGETTVCVFHTLKGAL